MEKKKNHNEQKLKAEEIIAEEHRAIPYEYLHIK